MRSSGKTSATTDKAKLESAPAVLSEVERRHLVAGDYSVWEPPR